VSIYSVFGKHKKPFAHRGVRKPCCTAACCMVRGTAFTQPTLDPSTRSLLIAS
jgi:hypothetical protein